MAIINFAKKPQKKKQGKTPLISPISVLIFEDFHTQIR